MEKGKCTHDCPWLYPVSLGSFLALMAYFSWMSTYSSFFDLLYDLAFLTKSLL
jgi:hypothetical protein